MARVLSPDGFAVLLHLLQSDGYLVYGPTPADRAIRVGPLRDVADLPRGVGDDTAAGRYRLTERQDGAWFGFAAPSDSYKSLLLPASEVLFTAEVTADGVRFHPSEPRLGPMAFVGIRGCDVAAIGVLDRVLGRDPRYASRREGLLLVAVDCAEPAATCCCSSLGTGPAAGPGADLVLTELQPGTAQHRFLARPGTDAGALLLDRIPATPARPADTEAARQVHSTAEERIVRRLRPGREPDPQHPAWQHVADRCLACGNCTLVCPTCFCTDVDDAFDTLGGPGTVSRTRRWSTCFERTHSALHGGAVHADTMSRYRQWLDHKLFTWAEQFGTAGCVGCGRCIAWCPVGIDITAEAAALQGSP